MSFIHSLQEITDEIVRKYEEIVQVDCIVYVYNKTKTGYHLNPIIDAFYLQQIQSYNEDKRKLSRLYSKLSHLKKQIEEFHKK